MTRRCAPRPGVRPSVLVLALVLCPVAAHSGETDQYLAWGVELQDSAEALNRFVNTEIEQFLQKVNRPDKEPYGPEELTGRVFMHFFQGLHASRVRNWVNNSDEVDRHPDSSISFFKHQNMSIYRRRSFPYILPMARTVRIGDVYCGVDKIAHFFGFGRRFYNRYVRLRAKGYTDEEAMEKIVLAGVLWEHSVVGKLVDGIFSHADLEADFQGFLLAKNLCGGDAPHLERKANEWVLVRPIDVRTYVTPDFDETFNPSHYWALRKRFVLPLLKEEYGDMVMDPAVQARFARYSRREPSFSKRTITAHFAKQGADPQTEQFREAFGVPPGRLACTGDALQAASE